MRDTQQRYSNKIYNCAFICNKIMPRDTKVSAATEQLAVYFILCLTAAQRWLCCKSSGRESAHEILLWKYSHLRSKLKNRKKNRKTSVHWSTHSSVMAAAVPQEVAMVVVTTHFPSRGQCHTNTEPLWALWQRTKRQRSQQRELTCSLRNTNNLIKVGQRVTWEQRSSRYNL